MKFGNKLRTVAVVAAVSLAFTAAGCGGGGGEAAPGAEASAPAEDANLAITFLPKNLGNPYFDVSAKGGEAAVNEFGAPLLRLGQLRPRLTPKSATSIPSPSSRWVRS